MAITKTTLAKKAIEAPGQPSLPQPVTTPKATGRTAANHQIHIDDSTREPIAASEATLLEPAPVSAEQREQMIRDTAYFLAQRRGFTEGNPEVDWVEAEAEINRLLLGGQASPTRK
jgi:hypothetical protein